jgi:carbamoyl-phosphate synthase large subunit
MRSTGEVMGVGETFGEAFAKAQLAAGTPIPNEGALFLSVNDRDKPTAVEVAKRFHEYGFELYATRGTAAALRGAGLPVRVVFKVNEGRPNAVDLLKAGKLNLIIYTTTGGHSFSDEKTIRRNAVTYRTPCVTTMSGARAAAQAIVSKRRDPIRVWSLQELHAAAPRDSEPSRARQQAVC